MYAVMIASGQQRCAGGRTQGRGVELVVLQARRRDLVDARRRYRPAKGAAGTKAYIVQHHQQHVRRTCRLLIQWQRASSGVLEQSLDVAIESFRGFGYIAHTTLNGLAV